MPLMPLELEIFPDPSRPDFEPTSDRPATPPSERAGEKLAGQHGNHPQEIRILGAQGQILASVSLDELLGADADTPGPDDPPGR